MGKFFAGHLFYLLVTVVAGRRPPDYSVGHDDPAGAYLDRWYLTPWRGWYQQQNGRWARLVKAVTRRCLPNLYLHRFLRDDDDRALHDHPSWAVSFILRGSYIEHTIAAGGIHQRRCWGAGSLRFLRLRHAHRIELQRDADGNPLPCWTLFLFGPAMRDWGFHCPQRGWVPWQQFTAAGKPGEIGKGCDA